MSTISSGTTTNTAYVITPDTTGKLVWQTNGTTTGLTLDASQNLGLGTAPSSSWGGVLSGRVFQTGGAVFAGRSDNSDAYVGTNFYRDSSNTYRYLTTAAASYQQLSGGNFLWFNAPSGTAGNAITFTQAMTLNASGYLGIGTTSPSYVLDIVGSFARLYSNSSTTQAVFVTGRTQTYGDSQFGTAGASGDIVTGSASGDTAINANNSTSKILFGINGTQKAQFDSSGNLLVNTTSSNVDGRTGAKLNVVTSGYDTVQLKGVNSNYLNIASWIPINAPGSGSAYHIGFGDGTSSYTERGVISTNGTGTTYGTNSDYRLKENVQPMTGALAKVTALKPVTYKWKENGLDGEGFIAHELAEICPHAVVGEKDGVKEDGSPLYQNIDTSFLVATLTAAIQELNTLVTAQAAEIAALKAKVGA